MTFTMYNHSFEYALKLLTEGRCITRAVFGRCFLFMDGNSLRCGSYIGETSLGTSRPYSLTDDDKNAQDWTEYKRTLIDSWDGCDVGDGIHLSHGEESL